jgi:hypothetical protein
MINVTMQKIFMADALHLRKLKKEEIVRSPRSLAPTPVFQVMFAWQNAGESNLELLGLTLAPLRTPFSFAKFDLTLSVAEAGGHIVRGLQYVMALFDRVKVERHAGHL